MNVQLKLNMKLAELGYIPTFKAFVNGAAATPIVDVLHPITLELWKVGAGKEAVVKQSEGYDSVCEIDDGYIAEAEIDTSDGGRYRVEDKWISDGSDTWQIHRKITVLQGAENRGFRLILDFTTAFPENTSFTDLRYSIPPVLWDKNDLDDDGLEDYLGIHNVVYREDRLNALSAMAFSEKHNLSITLFRSDLPSFDSTPDRPNKEQIFLQRTDIGSLGVWQTGDQMSLRAQYPFYEGERSHALLVGERPDWGSFWPAETGEIVDMSYGIRVEAVADFIDAKWQTYTRRLDEINSERAPLPADANKLTKYRLEALDRYYIEKDAEEDSNEPAGYVLNCHPQNGVQLSNIIQFGFTGQNILSAYNVLRFGVEHGNEEYVRKALRVVDFFVQKAHLPETGLFYNLYNVEKGSFDFWWTGLLLPLAYAEGERLEQLMGPLYKHREFVIEALRKQTGSYLRCMNEDAHALLRVYQYEESCGNHHEEWLAAARCYGEFLLRTQEDDGSWYRAYELNGKPITEPAIWFGTTVYEQKSSTASSVPFLVELYKSTQDERFLKAAKKAGHFVREIIVKRVKFNGGIHDSMYSKGQLIDNESIYFPAIALLALYKATKEEYFLDGAYEAGRMNAMWAVLWDVPLPEESTLAKYGFRSTGIGGCDTPGAGYVHSFENSGVAELVELAQLTGDKHLLRVAELLWHGCNQAVATPGKDWGYAYTGLQEEGYMISWCWVDDPMFGNTGFGGRWKGEGNKTCFPWIAAVAVECYWKLIDQFGTADFDKIKKKLA